MRESLKQALNNTEILYDELIAIANDITNEYTKTVDAEIKQAQSRVNNMSNDDLRNFMLNLSLMSYSFGDVKEKSALKAECAEALKKEAYAKRFNTAEGNNAIKDNTALLQTSDEIVVNAVHELVASLLKTKLDEIHRIVATLQSILMSRMQEAKLSQSLSVGSPGERPYITE